MRKVQLVIGLSLSLCSLAAVALADTGAGGGCHTDVYWDTDANWVGMNEGEPQQRIVCKKIDCPNACPDPSPVGGGYSTCMCPEMEPRCNAAMKGTSSGAPLLNCYFPCPGTDCESTTDTPSNTNPWGNGQGGKRYDQKFTCWCE